MRVHLNAKIDLLLISDYSDLRRFMYIYFETDFTNKRNDRQRCFKRKEDGINVAVVTTVPLVLRINVRDRINFGLTTLTHVQLLPSREYERTQVFRLVEKVGGVIDGYIHTYVSSAVFIHGPCHPPPISKTTYTNLLCFSTFARTPFVFVSYVSLCIRKK